MWESKLFPVFCQFSFFLNRVLRVIFIYIRDIYMIREIRVPQKWIFLFKKQTISSVYASYYLFSHSMREMFALWRRMQHLYMQKSEKLRGNQNFERNRSPQCLIFEHFFAHTIFSSFLSCSCSNHAHEYCESGKIIFVTPIHFTKFL